MILKFKFNSNIKYIISIIAILTLIITLYILYIKFNNYDIENFTSSSNILSNNPTEKKKAFNKIANKVRNRKNNKKSNNTDNNIDNNINNNIDNNIDNDTVINNTSSKKSIKYKKNNTKKESFDDVVANFEEKSREMYKDAEYMYDFQDILKNYWSSFDTKEFKRKSNNTGEVLDKFSLYKERFFDIFE